MIVIFGGSFNPPTVDHYEIAKQVSSLSFVSKLIFVPVGDQYNKAGLIPSDYRLNMLHAVANKLSKVEVSDVEVSRDKPLKTLETLMIFKEVYNTEELGFVMGADNLEDLKNWYKYEQLLSQFKILVVNRNQSDVLKYIKKSFPTLTESFIFVDGFISKGVSSSQFRNNPAREDIIMPEVLDYIKSNSLYGV